MTKHGRSIDADALINAVERQSNEEGSYGYMDTKSIVDLINDMPSAQPTEASCWGCNCPKMERLKEQKTFSEMVHLHDAETHDKRTETHSCDTISRQAALDALEWKWAGKAVIDAIKNLPSAQPEPHYDEWCMDCKEYDKERHCCPRWNRVIRQTLKDAQPEQKTGKWLITDAYPHNVYCSVCHTKFAQTHWTVWKDGSLPRKFCPNCGLIMEEK